MPELSSKYPTGFVSTNYYYLAQYTVRENHWTSLLRALFSFLFILIPISRGAQSSSCRCSRDSLTWIKQRYVTEERQSIDSCMIPALFCLSHRQRADSKVQRLLVFRAVLCWLTEIYTLSELLLVIVCDTRPNINTEPFRISIFCMFWAALRTYHQSLFTLRCQRLEAVTHNIIWSLCSSYRSIRIWFWTSLSLNKETFSRKQISFSKIRKSVKLLHWFNASP